MAFRYDPEHHRSVAMLAFRLCKKCSASSVGICPKRSGGSMVAARMGVRGKGRQSLAALNTAEFVFYAVRVTFLRRGLSASGLLSRPLIQ
jgi:hypothetical protein